MQTAYQNLQGEAKSGPRRKLTAFKGIYQRGRKIKGCGEGKQLRMGEDICKDISDKENTNNEYQE